MFYNFIDLWKICNGYFESNHLFGINNNKWLLLTLLLIFTTILYNISQVQMTVFLVWGIFKSISYFENKKSLKGGNDFTFGEVRNLNDMLKSCANRSELEILSTEIYLIKLFF